MVELTDTETSVKLGREPDEFELQQTTRVKVHDEANLSNMAEHLVEAQTQACGHKTNPKAKSDCEIQQEELIRSSPEVSTW